MKTSQLAILVAAILAAPCLLIGYGEVERGRKNQNLKLARLCAEFEEEFNTRSEGTYDPDAEDVQRAYELNIKRLNAWHRDAGSDHLLYSAVGDLIRNMESSLKRVEEDGSPKRVFFNRTCKHYAQRSNVLFQMALAAP